MLPTYVAKRGVTALVPESPGHGFFNVTAVIDPASESGQLQPPARSHGGGP